MAKTLIGNIKGKNGRGITSIKKTGTTGSVDTYTITYTDNTTSTFTINNSDSISLQRQIVPSAAVESSTTASQAYAAGDYVVVNGVLRKVKSAIAKGGTISDSNSTATTVTGELANFASSKPLFKTVKYTSPQTSVDTQGVLEFTKKLDSIAGYTPVGIVETNTNHDWSFGLMRATLNGDDTFTCTWMNFNKNTWNGSIGYVTVLYIRS